MDDDADRALRPVSTSRPPPPSTQSLPAMRPPVRPSPAAARPGSRRVGLFFKVFLGDMTIWAVLSGVLTYEVARRGMAPEHAIAGAIAGLLVAIAVSIGLKQIANRVVRLNRSALEISRGDLSKALPTERSSMLGAD